MLVSSIRRAKTIGKVRLTPLGASVSQSHRRTFTQAPTLQLPRTPATGTSTDISVQPKTGTVVSTKPYVSTVSLPGVTGTGKQERIVSFLDATALSKSKDDLIISQFNQLCGRAVGRFQDDALKAQTFLAETEEAQRAADIALAQRHFPGGTVVAVAYKDFQEETLDEGPWHSDEPGGTGTVNPLPGKVNSRWIKLPVGVALFTEEKIKGWYFENGTKYGGHFRFDRPPKKMLQHDLYPHIEMTNTTHAYQNEPGRNGPLDSFARNQQKIVDAVTTETQEMWLSYHSLACCSAPGNAFEFWKKKILVRGWCMNPIVCASEKTTKHPSMEPFTNMYPENDGIPQAIDFAGVVDFVANKFSSLTFGAWSGYFTNGMTFTRKPNDEPIGAIKAYRPAPVDAVATAYPGNWREAHVQTWSLPAPANRMDIKPPRAPSQIVYEASDLFP